LKRKGAAVDYSLMTVFTLPRTGITQSPARIPAGPEFGASIRADSQFRKRPRDCAASAD